MKELEKLFYKLKEIIRKEENHIKQNSSLGGIWYVDTYELNNVKYQLMDEGYSEKIFNESFEITCNYENKIKLEKGTLEDANKIYQSLK